MSFRVLFDRAVEAAIVQRFQANYEIDLKYGRDNPIDPARLRFRIDSTPETIRLEVGRTDVSPFDDLDACGVVILESPLLMDELGAWDMMPLPVFLAIRDLHNGAAGVRRFARRGGRVVELSSQELEKDYKDGR